MSAVRMQDLPLRHRITVQEYHRMAEVGLLAPDARVELIEGEIIDMAPIEAQIPDEAPYERPDEDSR